MENSNLNRRPCAGSFNTTLRAFAAVCVFAASAAAAPPDTPKKPVTDTYHGVAVADDYRWLEKGDDKAVQAWSDAQNAYARALLDKLPGAAKLKAELTKILAAKIVSHSSIAIRGGKVFALRREPPKQQPFLVVMPALDRPEEARILLDPNELDKEGNTTIDWLVPSPDGKLVAVSISKGGSESGDLHLLDSQTGALVDVVVPRVHGGTAGGDLAWAADGKGFYYTRYPRAGERPAEELDFHQQLYFHALGTATEQDRYELGEGFARIAEIRIEVHEPTGRVLCSVQDGDGGEFSQLVRSTEGKWKLFAGFKDGAVQAAFGSGDALFVVSRKDAFKGKILRLNAADPDLAKSSVVVPEGEESIVTDFYTPPEEATVQPTATRLYVTYQLGGPSAIRCFAYDGKPLPAPVQPPIASAGHLARDGDGDDVVFAAESFVEPAALYLYRADESKTATLPLFSKPVVDFSDVEVVREFAVSKDGAKVPVSIMRPKGAKLDGSNPCLVTGYGGYGMNIEPAFAPARRVLLDRGFVLAVANLRGGGEYGEEWHLAGNLTKKQNVFDDFAAALQHMIDRRYTSKSKLAIEGGSNGGLLMGATLTQHPDLMQCAVSHVGIYDMLRSELGSNGTFNIPEFGTVKDPEQFKALYAYSPYHRVKEGTNYPATLLLTGSNDPRVDPMQSRKMAARLQAANPSGMVLLRTTADAGHGLAMALSEEIDEKTAVTAFLFWQLGVTP